MSKYRTEFQLNKSDIDLIETAIRTVIQNGVEFGVEKASSQSTVISKEKLQQLNQLLAKLHHQKVFYSQVKQPGVPAA